MGDQTKNAVGYFNFAHSNCASAIALQEIDVDATHHDSPVYYLFYHSIELYLKSYLLLHNVELPELEKKYGHKTRKLANRAKRFGLRLCTEDEQAISQMAKTSNVISSRYLSIGTHQLLPMIAYHETCYRLHHQMCEDVYAGVGGTRRPVLNPPKENSLVGHPLYSF